ncbi:hypothetical protein GCM10022261_10960 [Brevibacterium daeguense]|uniref:Lipoprotein LpqN n=1 Tax=Brevibacterium daeguense TaxID=909936 RepID=A0ABP8EHX1_9MICO|nr:hypothetical protein [Brevibacterium daeguense]
MRSPLLTAGAVAATAVLLSGCGALQVRTAEGPGAPIGVGVAPTAGPTPTPTETGPQLPQGYTEHRIDFGGECPIPVVIAVPEDWEATLKPGAFQQLLPQDQSLGREGPTINVNCREAFLDKTAIDLVNSQERFSFTEPGSEIVAERKGQLGNGYSWGFQAELAPTEILAGGHPQVMYGAEIGYSYEGKLYQVSYHASSLREDAEGLAMLRDAADHVEVDGLPVTMPRWVV